MESKSEDRISPFFAGRIIFIAGGSGFVGKVFLEKLLRSCPDIGKIYLLIRSKKGKDPHERLKTILNDVLFESVRKERGINALTNQCSVIAGDCMEIGLGISEEDKNLLTNSVEIFYNFAATIRFDETLKRATLLNTRGTRELLELAKQCKKLELFIHMSTSYCHLKEKYLLEKPYDPPADPHKIIKLAEILDDTEMKLITAKVLDYYPNTYAYTKSLGEALVCEASNQIPTLILRPSIILPVWREPIQGWTDNINGPVGLLIAGGKGVVRIMHCDYTTYGDFVPVDYLANALCVSTWNYIGLKDHNRKVTNYVSSAEIKVSWQEVVEYGRAVAGKKVPFNNCLWYPGGGFTKSKISFYIQNILFHWIPAILVDCLLFCFGYPPVLCKVQRRIANGFDVVCYYANNQWDFNNDGLLYLRSLLNEAEKIKFRLDPTGFDILHYVETCILSARRYVLKEPDHTLPRARKIMKVLYISDRICKLIFTIFLVYWTSQFFIFLYKKVF